MCLLISKYLTHNPQVVLKTKSTKETTKIDLNQPGNLPKSNQIRYYKPSNPPPALPKESELEYKGRNYHFNRLQTQIKVTLPPLNLSSSMPKVTRAS